MSPECFGCLPSDKHQAEQIWQSANQQYALCRVHGLRARKLGWKFVRPVKPDDPIAKTVELEAK